MVHFWGVRGSIPAPGSGTARYGGNTPCVEISCGDHKLIFDLGTGARNLGEPWQAPAKATVFLSHYHYDHLQGLPFFTPIFDPRNEFTVYGPSREGKTVRQILFEQMRQPYFPVAAEHIFNARVDYRPFRAGERLSVGDAVVSATEVNHPGANLAYRVDYCGRSVVYATDVEHGSGFDEPFTRFAKGVDLLIYDAMYTEDEYRGRHGPPRIGWGHSSWESAVEVARACGAKTLALFHHDPSRDDKALEQLLKQARSRYPSTILASESEPIRL